MEVATTEDISVVQNAGVVKKNSVIKDFFITELENKKSNLQKMHIACTDKSITDYNHEHHDLKQGAVCKGFLLTAQLVFEDFSATQSIGIRS